MIVSMIFTMFVLPMFEMSIDFAFVAFFIFPCIMVDCMWITYTLEKVEGILSQRRKSKNQIRCK